jgi:hypothetical protein
LTGNIGKPLLTLQGTNDPLLTMRLHSNRYRSLIENRGKGNMHLYYDQYRKEPSCVRPILPC